MAAPRSYNTDPDDDVDGQTEDKIVGGYAAESETVSYPVARRYGLDKDDKARTTKTETRPYTPYRESDISRPPEDIARLQRRMVDAGVLKGKYMHGIWDPSTREAYEIVLTVANSAGVTWDAALSRWDELMRDTEGDEGEKRFGQTYVVRKPNAARLRKESDELAKSMIGRVLSEAEREQFVQDAIMKAAQQERFQIAAQQRTSTSGAADEILEQEELDPLADLEQDLKKRFPQEYAGQQFLVAGNEFLDLLRSPV